MNGLPPNTLEPLEEVEHELAKLAGQREAEHATTVLTEVAKANDVDRLLTGACLVNAFNFAIQQQARREQWTADDFRSFCIALGAMDTIK